MTEQESQQLSRDVAEKYGNKPNTGMEFCNEKAEPLGIYKDGKWLHDDIGRCATLAIEHDVWAMQSGNLDRVLATERLKLYGFVEKYADHDNNKIRATCVAILKALLAKDKP